jgi:RNA polymerase sigma-70 factor (ECF subfamily)
VSLAQQEPPPGRILPWLYRSVRNAALAAQRSAWRRRKREGRVHSDEAWFARTDERVEADEATKLLRDLPLEQRETIVARLWGGLTFEEIAGLADCSTPTAHRRYQVGLAELRLRLEGPCPTNT